VYYIMFHLSAVARAARGLRSLSSASLREFSSTSRTGAEVATGDCLKLRGMVFYGYHGALPEEKTLGQRFEVDVDVFRDLSKAGATDALSDTLNYAVVYDHVKDVMEGESYDLLEAVADRIARKVLNEDGVTAVKLEIQKPSVPVPGVMRSMGVAIFRTNRPFSAR
jgi:dihydroneopterin aldolase